MAMKWIYWRSSRDSILAIDTQWKEQANVEDGAALRALEWVEGKGIKMKILLAKTEIPYRLKDGTWVMDTRQLLDELSKYTS